MQTKYFFIAFLIFISTSCSDTTKTQSYVPHAKEIESRIYIFGIHPYLNSKKMYLSYRPILDLIEHKIGNIKILLETSSSYENYNDKLYNGHFDFSLPNPYQTYNALSHGYKVIAKMKPDNVFRGIFIARKDSNLTSVSQLRGKSISFPAPSALAATMMPLYYLHIHGIDIQKDIEKKYVGSQYSSILNVFSGYTIAGATWPPPWEEWKKENPIQAKEMEVVWQTKSLINNSVIVKENIDIKIVEQLMEILITLDTHQIGKTLLNNAGFEGFAKAENSDYSIVNDFLQKYNKVAGISQ